MLKESSSQLNDKELKLAHSLFEPVPEPLTGKLWRRVRDLSPYTREIPKQSSVDHTDPTLMAQAIQMDARGQQQLLEAVLITKPIKT